MCLSLPPSLSDWLFFSIITLDGLHPWSKLVSLVDLEACATSNYELLSEPTVKGGIYTRAFQFVNASKVLLQEVARASGSVSASPACTSCVGNGTLVRGLRAEIRGTVSVLGDNKIPPTVELTSAIHSNGQAIVCENAKSRAFDLMESNSGGSGTLADPTAVMLGEEVCFEGFVMDNFCIERGTLLDKPEVVTLLGPERHSAHWCVFWICLAQHLRWFLPNKPPQCSKPKT